MRNRTVRAAALAVVLVLAAGIAYASIPDANGVIHGCRKNSGGALRVIDTDAGQTCMANETALNWSQTGPQGPGGPQGPAGGVSGHEVVSHFVTLPLNPGATSTRVLCPVGKVVLGGGGGATTGLQASVSFELLNSAPFIDPDGADGWQIAYRTSPDTGDEILVFVQATCAAAVS